MAGDPTQPATQADVQFLAELIAQNTSDIAFLKERQESMEERMDEGFERMDAGFARVEKAITGLSKYLSRHDDMLHNHEQRIRVLETAA